MENKTIKLSELCGMMGIKMVKMGDNKKDCWICEKTFVDHKNNGACDTCENIKNK
jgi:hypothetical protein